MHDDRIRFVMLSDTHGFEVEIPNGDVLLYGGDFSAGRGSIEQTYKFAKWIGSQPHEYKIMIAGNHDFPLDNDAYLCKRIFEENEIVWLRESHFTIYDNLVVWGSAYHPKIWGKFELERSDMPAVWALIPEKVDILLTHGPPRGIMDYSVLGANPGNVGDDALNAWYLERKVNDRPRPMIHMFGHIHEGYGVKQLTGTWFYNASICNEHYEPVNKPFVWDFN